MKHIVLAATLMFAQPLWAATYVVDHAKSSVIFTGTHAGNTFEGTFENWQANIVFDASNLQNSTFDATFDLTSAKTGNKMYDGTLPKADWFDVKNHSEGTFKSTSIQETGTPNMYLVEGTLSLRGTTQPVRFTFNMQEQGAHTIANSSFEVDRLAYGIGQKSDAKAEWVSRNISLEMNISATKQ